MLPQIAVEPGADALFRREIENCQALRHPNVVRTYASGRAGGVYFLAMEFCEGGSLDQIVQREGPLAVEEAVTTTLNVLAGLEYAHAAPIGVAGPDGAVVQSRGLVHRDVKPQNIFLTRRGGRQTGKVGDFGLAKAFELAGMSALTRTGTSAGTPAFMPRQQVLNFRYAKPEVDVWATAASLYYALTGHTPRDFLPGRDPWRTVWDTAPVPIAERGIPVPDRLARVIDEALLDNPEIRFKTAAALRQALEGA
jgi:serine/threonine protein kinase